MYFDVPRVFIRANIKMKTMKKILSILIFLIFVSALCSSLEGRAQTSSSRVVMTGPIGVPAEISMLYSDDASLFWETNRQTRENRLLVADILDKSVIHGLGPEQYGVTQIRRGLNAKIFNDNQNKYNFDYALTYALWRYASELAGRDIPEREFRNIVSAPDMMKRIGALAPRFRLYRALQDRLTAVNAAMEEGRGVEKMPDLDFGGGLLKVGQSHPNIPLLKEKMTAFGLYEGNENTALDGGVQSTTTADRDNLMYDERLAAAVRDFQTQNGLKADAIIGPATLDYMNRTIEDEREQLIANLARLRDLEWRNRPPLRIDVDIARYYLKAYEEGRIVFEMPVVVGSKQRQTVAFSTVMTGVRLNPGWTLPSTIKTEDYIPKLRTDPQWVTDQGVKIYADWLPDSEPIDPHTVDWSLLTDNEIKAMRMYKPAGEQNPLGQYRFLMNNKYDIYLHDTNSKSLFNRAVRTQSSGCVRVYNPRKIAEFLLAEDPSWTAEKLDEVLASGKTYDLGAKRSIPVYFDYKTVWLDERGKLVLGRDIYDFDKDSYRAIVEEERKTKDKVALLLDGISAMTVSVDKAGYESNNSQDTFPISLF